MKRREFFNKSFWGAVLLLFVPKVLLSFKNTEWLKSRITDVKADPRSLTVQEVSLYNCNYTAKTWWEFNYECYVLMLYDGKKAIKKYYFSQSIKRNEYHSFAVTKEVKRLIIYVDGDIVAKLAL